MAAPVTAVSRRGLLACGAALLAPTLPGCATAPKGEAAAPTADGGRLRPWRTVQGGFLSAAMPLAGAPLRPGTGAFVRLTFPSAVALRDAELLVVDSGAARVWRCDIAFGTLVPIAGAPATPLTRVALGPDLSAYVLDAPARRLLRFGRDGRLLQTLRADDSLADPVDFALARDSAAVVIADRTLSQVAIVGPAGGIAVPLRATRSDGVPAQGAAVAMGADDIYLLDVAAGAVHRIGRNGAIRLSFGQGLMTSPAQLAIDRFERVYVADPAAGRVHVFGDGLLLHAFGTAELGVQRIGGIAIDGDVLAVGDTVAGQVVLVRLGAPR